MTDLFDPLTIRGVTMRNRIAVSPMQQYCASDDGKPTDWHLANLLPRAQGGAGLVMSESTAVSPEGRVGHWDIGLWDDDQIPAHARLAGAVRQTGAIPGVQLGHGGRKVSRRQPWLGGPLADGWTPVAPSAIAYADFAVPRALTTSEVAALPQLFTKAAWRGVRAGYQLVELHVAHGYLLHSFLSPLSNQRDDRYGGSFENRSRIVHEVVEAVRSSIPGNVILSLRLSYTDWIPGGWTVEDSVRLAKDLEGSGVDLFDISSGGTALEQQIPIEPSYQLPGAIAVKGATSAAVASVGLITDYDQANQIVSEGKADIVMLARASMRDPNWPIQAAIHLGRTEAVQVPFQHIRAWEGHDGLRPHEGSTVPMAKLA